MTPLPVPRLRFAAPLALLVALAAGCGGQGGVQTVAAPAGGIADVKAPAQPAVITVSPQPSAAAPAAAGAGTGSGVTTDGHTTVSAATVAAAATTPEAPLRDQLLTLAYGGMQRSYLLHLPPASTARTRMPLLMVLHGLHGGPWPFATTTGFSQLADQQGFVVVYPAGYHASWDAGTCCGDAAAAGLDDVGFLLAVRAAVIAEAPVDPSRVFVTGFSNGGMMSYRLACEATGSFRAVAVVSGTLVTDCAGGAPIPLLHVHGLSDPTVPFAGRAFSTTLHSPLRPVDDAVEYWRLRDGSTAPVDLVTLPGVRHVWPTSANAGYDATSAIWSFFSRYAG